MKLQRRSLIVAGAAFALCGAGAAYGIRRAYRHRQDLAIAGDDGEPVLNRRLPAGTAGRLAGLPDVTVVGAEAGDVTLYAFSDFNCPDCHAAAADLAALLAGDQSLRVCLVSNPIVSVPSAQAARVMLAVQRQAGSEAAYRLYSRLFGSRGRIDALRALDQAQAIGLSRADLEQLMEGEPVHQALRRQMQEAKDLGLFATPAYVLGDLGLVGHPGPKALAGMIAAMRACDRVACG